MSASLFSAAHLAGGNRAGYRLRYLEVYNWGTFDKRVWRVVPNGDTSLLTGDIGSGKSTLVDALTTLLLPANRIAYNKAAGAESRERTLRSYVEGHFKSERNEVTGTSKPVGLRGHNAYSVILGVFVNEGFDEEVTLAQVFHQKDPTGQPDRFYVTASKALSVEPDFTDFGSDLIQLRKRLRSTGVDLADGYPEYSRQFRRLLGIRSEQALKLFLQTVSMKSVGNLNEFVRSHMLEPVDASVHVDDIVNHFQDLAKAYEAVTRAREQLAALEPLVEAAHAYDDATERRAQFQHEGDAVRFYIAELRSGLLEVEIEQHREDRIRAEQELARLGEQATGVGRRRDALITERAGAGGDRITELERIASVARADVESRRVKAGRYAELLAAAGMDPAGDEPGFVRALEEAGALGSSLADQLQGLDGRHGDRMFDRERLSRVIEETNNDLESLRGRRSNLPRKLLEVRSAMCGDLGLQIDDLPFAGELVDVSDEHSEWRPAAERVLGGFAQSLLVDQDLYRAVSDWVNGRHLGLRLVYERVPRHRVTLQSVNDTGGMVLAETLEVATGPFEDYVRSQLGRRASHLCARTMGEFREAERAVTMEGQVRSGDHHEKDDRHRADDPRYWLLGWSNQSKIDALEAHLVVLQTELSQVNGVLREIGVQRQEVLDRLNALSGLAQYTDWRELDVEEAEERRTKAEAERELLLSGSSELADIEKRLEAVEAELEKLAGRQRHVQSRAGSIDARIETATAARDADIDMLDAYPAEIVELARAHYSALEARLVELRPDEGLPKHSSECVAASEHLGESLAQLIGQAGRDQERHSAVMVKHMGAVRNTWPEATNDMDASVEARGEFVAFRERLETDDLPTYEEEFKRQLNTQTIRELAAFNNWLRRQREGIQERVDRINEALSAIDYSPGRIVKLIAEPTPNQEVKQFQRDLRDATDDTLTPDGDRYSEQRFEDVKRIIERFRGRVDHAEADKAWTAKVTDIRNWFTFAASEQDKISGEEYEHYRDSDGKSGGQKEKLAYTILAASLAYQFGLEWGMERSRDFRFVVIDEAFGRGSDDSTRYALELFAKLGLQLLVVTPLTKVHVIEPYVKAIGFVDNPERNYSRVQTLTLEEFRERRARGT